MNSRVALLLIAALFFGLATPAAAAIPEGPRLAISAYTDGPGAEDEGAEVITVGPSGENPQRLFGGRGGSTGNSISWSADGELLALTTHDVESTAEGAFGTGWSVVGVVGADGSNARAFSRAFLNGGDPVMAPDGRSVVFQRLKLAKVLDRESYLFRSAIFVLNLETGSVKRLTKWRLGSFLDPVFYSADGLGLIAESFNRGQHRMVAIDLRSLRIRRLAPLSDDTLEPTYSPDGTRMAFLRDKTRRFQLPKPDRPISELWVANANGSGAKRLLRVKGYISSPSWDPSGSRLAFARTPALAETGEPDPEAGSKVMAINADGTCLIRVFSNPDLTLGGIAWRPGIGREAGPIRC
jgi:Tol biopolymer transport system component